MKFAIFLLFALFAASIAQSNNTFLPVAIAHEGSEYVAFGSYLFAFSLPELQTLKQQNYSQNVISYPPISVNENNTLFLGDGIDGSFEIDLDTLNLTQNPGRAVDGQPLSGSLLNLQNEYCVTDSANQTKFCFLGGSPATITKTDVNGNNTIELGNYTVTRFIKVDEAAGLLHLTAELILGRGGNDADYWTFPLQGDFQIQDGPVTLNNTALSGCPVPPRSCAVAVLLYQDVYNGTLIYMWTIANTEVPSFETHVVTYNNGTFNETFFDDVTYTPTVSSGEESTESSDDSSDGTSDASESSSDDLPIGSSSDEGTPSDSEAPIGSSSPVVEER